MLKGKRKLLFLALPLIGLACVILGTQGGQTPGTGEPPSQSQSDSQPQNLPPVDFPQQPDPVTIQVTLDETHSYTSRSISGVALGTFMSATDASGAYYEVNLPDMMTVEAADGSMSPAAGTQVTITAIKSVEGLPFSGGLLTGIHFAPEGLQLVGPATVSITVPGSFDPSQLAVFTANGDGTEFHLIPVTLILPPSGEAQPTEMYGLPTFPPEIATYMPPLNTITNGTQIMVDVMHFSLLGVVNATVAEITAQTHRPPTDSHAQAAQLLTDPDLNAAAKKAVLLKEYEDKIKPGLLNADCGTAPRLAQRFLAWHNMVVVNKSENFFKPQTNEAVSWLRTALKICLENTCNRCMEKVDAREIEYFVVQYFYYSELGKLVNDTASNSTWWPLVNKCAVQQGYPEPLPAIASCGEDCADAGPTPVLTCP